MSTRAVIARVLPEVEGGFKGVYHHSDGYPEGLGKHLWGLVHGQFAGRLPAMLTYLIDQHSAGWSCLLGEARECYCHPKRKRAAEPMGNWYTHENIEGDIEWLYAFDELERRLYIRDTRHDAEVIVSLDEPEPDWLQITCGETLERCTHCAYIHFPELIGTPMERLGTDTYLGRSDFNFHDTVAVMYGGRRYKMTGSGGNAAYYRRSTTLPIGSRYAPRLKSEIPDNAWISDVLAGNGKRIHIPTALSVKDGYEPYPGVTWIFPPTKHNPNETERAA